MNRAGPPKTSQEVTEGTSFGCLPKLTTYLSNRTPDSSFSFSRSILLRKLGVQSNELVRGRATEYEGHVQDELDPHQEFGIANVFPDE